jgi:transaldolase
MGKNKVKSIHDFGQSIWLDYLDRAIMDSGDLQKLIDEDGVRGLTSNPSIFEKAIGNSSLYDTDIELLSKQETSNDKIFFDLAVKDIQRAADMFSPLYQHTHGEDGYVSLEVSPHLARDTEETINQANKLWRAVDRKNVMIKIPGTTEGLLAIRKCISEGLNINITLLFGLPRYKEVANAYLSGLEDRVKLNQSIEAVASVASFFLSRIDVMIDPILNEKRLNNLKGKVAIASAKMAYEIYREIFSSERFKKLEAKGAKHQRVLWASTSSKDPSDSDVKYVEALIGKETINTIPMETLIAFRDHGNAANCLEVDLESAVRVMENLKENKISIDSITQKLEDEGVEKFNTAYDRLLKGIEKQKQVTLSN